MCGADRFATCPKRSARLLHDGFIRIDAEGLTKLKQNNLKGETISVIKIKPYKKIAK